jgi:hypothetical protein
MRAPMHDTRSCPPRVCAEPHRLPAGEMAVLAAVITRSAFLASKRLGAVDCGEVMQGALQLHQTHAHSPGPCRRHCSTNYMPMHHRQLERAAWKSLFPPLSHAADLTSLLLLSILPAVNSSSVRKFGHEPSARMSGTLSDVPAIRRARSGRTRANRLTLAIASAVRLVIDPPRCNIYTAFPYRATASSMSPNCSLHLSGCPSSSRRHKH